MSRDALIDAEAQRRCRDGGYSLDMKARNLTSFPCDADAPLWRAYYVPCVEAEIEKLEDAGFEVLPKVRMTSGGWDVLGVIYWVSMGVIIALSIEQIVRLGAQ